MKYGIMLAFFILLNGCASIPSFQSKDNLSEYDTNKQIILDDDVIYKVKKGFVEWYFGVKKGVYTAKYQDDSGYYFEGPGYSSCIGTEGKTGGCTSELVGGIWQSKSNPHDFRMYYIDGVPRGEESNVQGFALIIGKYIVETASAEFSGQIKKKL